MAWLWGGRENMSLKNSMCKEKDTRTAARSQIQHQGKAAEVQVGGTDAQVDWPTEDLFCLGFWAMYLLLRKQGLKGSVLYTLSLRKLRDIQRKRPCRE